MSQYLKALRAQIRRPGRGGGAATAVAEAEVEAHAPPTPQEALDAARLAYSHAAGRLAALRSQGERELLSEFEETELLRLQSRIERMAPVVERLAKEASRVQAQMSAEEAVALFNACIPEKQHLWEQVVARLSDVQVLCQQLRQLDTRQWEPLLSLRKPNGQPAFPSLGGTDVVSNGFSRLPNGHGLVMSFLNPTSHPLTKGELADVLDADPGTRPINPRMIANHLKEF